MIIDIHTHTFPDKIAAPTIQKLAGVAHITPFSDGTTDGLRASMERSGVDVSVILPVATSARQVVHINDSSIRLNQEGQGILSFGCMHPDFPGWKTELSRIAAEGVKGIKIHPVYQDVDLDDIRFLRILERCGELGLAVLAHAGLDIGFPGKVNCSPEMSRRAVEQVGPVKLILAHMGGWRSWDGVEQLLVDTSVCLDTSFSLGKIPSNGDGYYSPADLELMEEAQFLRIVRAFGARRIFFGTDSPWGDPARGIAQIRALPLTREEQDAILGGNAQRLLGIS